MLQYQLPMGLRDAAHRRGGRESTKLLGILNIPWQGFRGETFTKIEAYAGMEKRMVRDLTIEEALQDEIKDTLEHNNQSYVDWCDLAEKENNNNKVKLTVTYDMGWKKRSSSRRYDSYSGHAFIIGGRSKGII